MAVRSTNHLQNWLTKEHNEALPFSADARCLSLAAEMKWKILAGRSECQRAAAIFNQHVAYTSVLTGVISEKTWKTSTSDKTAGLSSYFRLNVLLEWIDWTFVSATRLICWGVMK